MRPRDFQRARCYRAERAARDDVAGVVFRSLEAVQRYVDATVASGWWTERCPSELLGPILAGESRRARRATASRPRYECVYRDGSWIYLPLQSARRITLPGRPIGDWAWCDWVVLHELAHLGRPELETGHGPEWAGFFLALVDRFIGHAGADALRTQFNRQDVRYVSPAPIQLEMALLAVATRPP